MKFFAVKLPLIKILGKKNVIAREVPLNWSSFNNGDVFIIDIGDGIIQWNAPQSNRQEKMRGGQLARCIRDRERGGRIPIVRVFNVQSTRTLSNRIVQAKWHSKIPSF